MATGAVSVFDVDRDHGDAEVGPSSVALCYGRASSCALC
jgi:hypothetical protein